MHFGFFHAFVIVATPRIIPFRGKVHGTRTPNAFALAHMGARRTIFVNRAEHIRDGKFFALKDFTDGKVERVPFVGIHPAVGRAGMVKQVKPWFLEVGENGCVFVVVHAVEAVFFFEFHFFVGFYNCAKVVANYYSRLNIALGKNAFSFVFGLPDFPI